jgi:hypothetical protein
VVSSKAWGGRGEGVRVAIEEKHHGGPTLENHKLIHPPPLKEEGWRGSDMECRL